MGIKNWEFSMHSALRTAIKENPYDIVNLYLKLEKASKKYLENGEMEEGDVFKVCFETGIMLDVSFYKDYSTVVANYPDGKEKTLISEKVSYRKEYDELETLSDALKTVNLGIGPKYSKEFFDKLVNAKVGDVLVFDHGKSLLCDGIMNTMHSFVEVSKNIKVPYVSEFEKQERFTIDERNEMSIQRLYREVKDDYTNDIKMSITSVNNARLLLNKLLTNRDNSKEINIGPNKFVIQPNKESKGLIYFDNKGERISEEKLLVLLAWLDANPNRIEIKDIRPENPMREFSDILFKRTLDEKLSTNNFREALDFISGYCMKNPEVLQVDMASYIENNNDYEAVRFAFKYEDEELSIKKITYEDNDFNKNPKEVKEVTKEEVMNYCTMKYNEKFNYIKSKVLYDVYKDFPKWQGEFFNIVINKYVEKQMYGKSVMDMNVSYADKNVSSLMDVSFDENEYMDKE